MKKNLFEIAMAHRIPYAATACSSYADDMVRKFEKAMNIKGPAFIHILAPCPTGWGFDAAKTIEVGKMAVECGLWYLAEYEDDKVKINRIAKDPKPVDTYFKSQRRFSHLGEEQIALISEVRDREMAKIKKFADEA